MPSSTINIKRIYEKPEKSDGTRILVDRLWPRGLTKEKAAIDLWLKEIAPSNELRKWFGHEPAKWTEFRKRYLQELKKNPVPMSQLKDQLKKGKMTLLYSAKDENYNQAIILRELISQPTKD